MFSLHRGVILSGRRWSRTTRAEAPDLQSGPLPLRYIHAYFFTNLRRGTITIDFQVLFCFKCTWPHYWSPQRDLNSQTPAWRAGGFIHFAYGAIPLITTINHFLTQLFDTVGWSLLPHLVRSSEADLFSLLEIPFNNFLRKCAVNEKSYPFPRCTQVECQTLILCNSHNSPHFVCFPDLTYR